MRLVLRVDAGRRVGAGHAMRSLSLAEELIQRGHSVVLVGDISELPWVERYAANLGVKCRRCGQSTLDVEDMLSLRPDVAVLDGYSFDSRAVEKLSLRLPATAAIVDSQVLDYQVALFIDQTLAAESSTISRQLGDKVLAGSRYALVRSEIRLAKQQRVDWLSARPAATGKLHVTCTLGGADPNGYIVDVVAAIARLDLNLLVTVVAPLEHHPTLRSLPWQRDIESRLIQPTWRLPQLFARTHVAISGTGTSAWDLLTMRVPSAWVQVADNQERGFQAIREQKLGTCLGRPEDIVHHPHDTEQMLSEMFADWETLSVRLEDGAKEFDGLGASRVVDALENMFQSTEGYVRPE